MPRLKAVRNTMTQMQSALAEQNWEQLLQLDTQFSALLAAQGWNPQEQLALQELRAAYAAMQQACHLATLQLADQLAQFAVQRDVSLAYAEQAL